MASLTPGKPAGVCWLETPSAPIIAAVAVPCPSGSKGSVLGSHSSPEAGTESSEKSKKPIS